MMSATNKPPTTTALACPAGSAWYPLWKHMHDNHGLILLDSEINDMLLVADEMRQHGAPMLNRKLSLPAGSRAPCDRASSPASTGGALFAEIVICMNIGFFFALAAWAVLP